MIGNRRGTKWYPAAVIAAAVMLMGIGGASSADAPGKTAKASAKQSEAKTDPGEWKKVVEAAKKEGKVVMSGDPNELWRKTLVDMFQEEYPDIKVEYTGLNGRDFWPRVRQEREIGQKLWDLRAGGTSTAYEPKVNGFLDPIRPLLLPEIADGSKWIGGMDGLFSDREKKFIVAYSMYIQYPSYVNRDFLKESELRSSEQLLDPKFKGKMVMQTPTGGATFVGLCNLGYMYGERFLRELLAKQDVVVTGDNRQQAEWLVRGRYPIAIGFDEYQLIPFQKQGLGRNIKFLDEKVLPVATGFGGITLLKDAPHPNAARVYINWLLSQKTQERLSKNVRLNSRRIDVPVVDKDTAVDPAHLNNYYVYATEENMAAAMRFLPVIKESLKK